MDRVTYIHHYVSILPDALNTVEADPSLSYRFNP
jgi:hypothetical protein